MAGPAYCAATAAAVSTKRPVPMMAPIPRDTRLTRAQRTFQAVLAASPAIRAMIVAIGFLAMQIHSLVSPRNQTRVTSAALPERFDQM